MKIVIKKNEQVAKHTIDTKECIYPYAIKRAFRLAMELDGFAKQTIDEVFGESEDSKCKANTEHEDRQGKAIKWIKKQRKKL